MGFVIIVLPFALAFYGLSRIKFVYVVKRSTRRATSSARLKSEYGTGATRRPVPIDGGREIDKSKQEAIVSALVNLGCQKAKAKQVAARVYDPSVSLNDLIWKAVQEAA